MSKLARVAGYVWAAPLTLLGLVYVTLFAALGWYRHTGTFGDALVWNLVPEKGPSWLNKAWRSWGGHCIGNVVVLKYDVNTSTGKFILKHEAVHVQQCMVLGVFQPVLYGLASLMIILACPHSHCYYSNPFEIDARRGAGQVIDVEGAVARLKARAQKSHKT